MGCDRTPAVVPEWLAGLDDAEMSPDERAECDRLEKERDARIAETSIMKVAAACALLSHRWLTARYEQVLVGADAVLREALEIVLHDAVCISAKLHRALAGRDRHDDDGEDDHPMQNDWNGSAKVALISLERSAAAWRMIAHAAAEQTPVMLADQLRDLRRNVEDTFPNAWMLGKT